MDWRLPLSSDICAQSLWSSCWMGFIPFFFFFFFPSPTGTVVVIFSLSPCQDDECYEQSADVRSQLRFFEQLERIEKQRKDEQEREILLKAAKVSYCHLTIVLRVCVCVCVWQTVCYVPMQQCVFLCTTLCIWVHAAPAPALTDELECDTSGWSDLRVSSQAPGPGAPLSWLFLPGHGEEGWGWEGGGFRPRTLLNPHAPCSPHTHTHTHTYPRVQAAKHPSITSLDSSGETENHFSNRTTDFSEWQKEKWFFYQSTHQSILPEFT